MAQLGNRVELPGSKKEPLEDARPAGPVDLNQLAEVTVRLRRKASTGLDADLETLLAQEPAKRQYLTPEQFEEKYGSSEADFEKVENFAEDHRLSVVSHSAGQRTLVLRGTLGALEAAFGAKLEMYHHRSGTFRGRTGALTIPTDLKGIVVGVHGLDNRPLRKTRRRLVANAATARVNGASLAQRYAFPADADGDKQCIAFVELGGGYRLSEIKRYAKSLQLQKVPRVSAVSVNGAHNLPSTADSDDGEVVLDVEVAAAAAPGARLAVYFADNTDRDFIDAVLQAVHDKHRKPSVISISWGGPEDTWTDQSRSAMDEAFQAAALMGITVCVASGDHGTNDEPRPPTRVRVDYPASSPWVLACGGTDIRASGEVVWNDGDGWATGGGISTKYQVPSWQKAANSTKSLLTKEPGRGVPDVAGSATNYAVLVDGEDTTSGGTSAVAPLWAALIARLNQALGRRVGFVNPALYAAAAANKGFTDIIGGDNAAVGAPGYPSTKGWDPCTGLGTPKGQELKNAL
jgi:kumamolisin